MLYSNSISLQNYNSVCLEDLHGEKKSKRGSNCRKRGSAIKIFAIILILWEWSRVELQEELNWLNWLRGVLRTIQ